MGIGADVAPSVLCVGPASGILWLGGLVMSSDLFYTWVAANGGLLMIYCFFRYVAYWRPRPRRELRRHPGAAARPILDKVLRIK